MSLNHSTIFYTSTPRFLSEAPTGSGALGTPNRDDIPEADKWNLTLIYPNVDAWLKELDVLKSDYPKFKDLKGTLGTSPKHLLAAMEFQKELNLKIERLYQYAMLQVSEDGSNAEFLKRQGELQNLLTRIGEAAAYIEPEIQSIDDATFEKFITAPELATSWQTQLRKLRRFRPHTLTESEERLMALASSALHGHHQTFSQLTNIDMKFGTVLDEKKREMALTQSTFSSFLNQRDRDVRRRAFHQFYKEFSDHRFCLASAYSSSVKADVFSARARNYGSAVEAALFPDQVPVAVYDNLISSVHGHLDALYEYFELRRRALKLDKIHQYDTYVPIVSEIERHTTFDEAINLVLAALAPLGSDYVNTLSEGLNRKRWCDRYETKGKRSGAFSSGCYGTPPYILMNYKSDVFSDVYTLAHEAGHSMHTWYSQKTQQYQDSDYPIFLAEVASTFNEELLTHYLLENTTDPMMRAYLINRQLDDLRGTLFRQTMFAEFEKLVHAMEEAGEAVTLESLQMTYRTLLVKYFGPNFQLDPELDLECLRIPHFYNAFYVYKYATGISAAVALSTRVLTGEKAKLDAYLGFLNSGGSRDPLDTLESAGVDMRQPTPIETTLQLFSRRVEELSRLLA